MLDTAVVAVVLVVDVTRVILSEMSVGGIEWGDELVESCCPATVTVVAFVV